MAKYFDDPAALSADPQQVANYLLSRGWVLQEQIDNKASVWDLEEAGAEVWVPLRRELRDYRKLMSETFNTLENVEQRSIRSILQDLSLTWADLSRVRIDTGMFGSPTVPLGDGVTAIKKTRDLLTSGARWLDDPRAAYHTRPAGKVSRFLRELRLGQTELGSYIITVVSPLTGDDPHFSRASMLQVLKSVRSARSAAAEAIRTASLEPFNYAEGVSANLCEALVGLGESSPDGAVELHFAWSPRLQISGEQREDIVLDAGIVRTLQPAAEHLRQREPLPQIQIRGLVRDMTNRNEQEQVSEITLVAEVDGKLRRVRFELQGSNRRRAIEGFDRRLPIVVLGTLDPTGQMYTMSDIEWVRILDEEQFLPNEPDANEPSDV